MGAWSGTINEEEAFKALTHAVDRGIAFWDTAGIYSDCA